MKVYPTISLRDLIGIGGSPTFALAAYGWRRMIERTSKNYIMNIKQASTLLFLFTGSLFSCSNGEKPSNEEQARAEYSQAIQRIRNPAEVTALGKVIPEEEMLELNFETGGQVAQILVKEGESAADEELLITLDTDLEENELQNLETQLHLNRLEQQEARAQVAYYEKVLGQQQQTYQRLQRSVEADALPASQLDQTELELLNSRHQIDQQQRQVQRLALQEQQLRIRLDEVRLRRRQKQLYTPGAGSVIRWEVRTGAGVQAFQVVGTFAPAGPRLVEAEVDEYFAGNMAVGQKAIIKREGFSDTLAHGEVVFTAPNLSDKSILSEDNTQFEDLQVRRIKIRLKDGEELLLGMKVEAIIQISENR